ncbi:MAG TPA: exodeoxyribonuclease VII small subunit [Pyrinomonadaceae bacterium]|nr:exodeoxyribonuclease VII small subunit [Pyrinomonadaceae bacterium]
MNNGQEEGRTFEASLEALERIVQQLEDGDLPLEKSLELFEQGIRLSRECQERLGQAERRIEILLRDNQGRPVAKAFNAPAGEPPAGGENENGV